MRSYTALSDHWTLLDENFDLVLNSLWTLFIREQSNVKILSMYTNFNTGRVSIQSVQVVYLISEKVRLL